MVLLTAIFYCFREHTAVKLLLGVLLSLLDPLGPLAFCGIALYNGKREAKPPKYTFYLFYCLHFLLLSTVTQSILR